MKKHYLSALYIIVLLIFHARNSSLFAQTPFNDLRRLTDSDWLAMSTEERLDALNTSNNRAPNKTFFGDFNPYQDMYSGWGYDYYEMNDRYENYTFRGFENYNIIEDRRQKWYYNDFGDRLTKMTNNGVIWRERFYDNGRSDADNPSGFINSQIRGYDGIWVARESTDDWAISAVGAGALRTKLTPLTFSIPNMTGMTVDFQSKNMKARFVNSLASAEPTIGITAENVVMLRGGQIRRRFGALTVGATYANSYAVQQTREGGTDLRGHVSDFAPTPIIYAVRVLDDSPQDSNGPIVQNVNISINGRPRPDVIPTVILDDLRRELVTAVDSKAEQYYLEPNTPGDKPLDFDYITVKERMPKYLDYIYFNEYMHGHNTGHIVDSADIGKMKEYYQAAAPDGSIQVDGNQYVVYLFDLKSVDERLEEVAVELTVANDYRIQVSQIYTKKKAGGHDTKGDSFNHYNAEYWQTRAQAEGNIKDGSNLRVITIDFGYEVANIIYGLDAQFDYYGFKVNAEYVTNVHYWMFADGKPGTGMPAYGGDINERAAHRSSLTGHSYYVTVQKDWDMFGFSGEFFKMGKFYRPYMMYWYPTELVYASAPAMQNRNETTRISLIEDNDDNDAYPDIMHLSRIMAVNMQSMTDPDGTFPGNDLDHDGIPDNDKNMNNVPDYDEPFLMFDVDPDEYVFGDDFNNNNIPDFREDDMKVDTPYDLDRQGHHFCLRFQPQKNLNLYAGTMRTGGVGADNRTDNDYLKVNFQYNTFDIGTLFAEYRFERIKDNIQDKFVIVPTYFQRREGAGWMYSSYVPELYFDEVEYVNSKVNKVFIDTRLRPLPSFSIENHVKYIRNHQLGGMAYNEIFQPSDILSTLAFVNKIAYTKKLGNWTFSPGLKFRMYKKGRSGSVNPLDHYLTRIPVVYLKYRFTSATNITFGMQGMRGFELAFKDYIQKRNDFKQINYTLQIANKSTYMGFEVWGGFGIKVEDRKYDEAYRKFEEQKTSTFFVRLWLGY